MTENGRPDEVNQTTLAHLLSRSVVTVRNWERNEGLPQGRVAENGRDRLYDLRAVIEWWGDYREEQARPDEREEADLQTRRYRAAMARLDLAERERKLIPTALHQKMLGAVLGEVRARILNLPGSVVPQLVGLEEERDVAAVLRPAIDGCLQSLVGLADELEALATGKET